MTITSLDTYAVGTTLTVNGRNFKYYSIPALQQKLGGQIARLPFSLKVLLENLLRHEDGVTVTSEDIKAFAEWEPNRVPEREIAFSPARVLLQDFTGVPAIVDFAAMRDAMAELGGDPSKINPLVPAELVIDHSVQVDAFAIPNAIDFNLEKEYERNRERYAFLRWGQSAFDSLKVVPPGTGICHQVNLEYLARVVFGEEGPDNENRVYFDTLVGTDSHTTMVNGLAVLGWGVGGIEAEAAMLGQSVTMLIPQVVGFRLSGALVEGATATDLVLRITEMLRQRGVVGKFVEFYGPGVRSLGLADRATIANMAPEYGATCALFPIDAETLKYLRLTARKEEHVQLVEAYAKAQGVFHERGVEEPLYSETLELDLSTVEPSLAGPKRPQDRVSLREAGKAFLKYLDETIDGSPKTRPARLTIQTPDQGIAEFDLKHGSVVIAAITSCTNTSNPSTMVGAGILAKKAVQRGLRRRPWVKSSLAPGSKVVTEYLNKAQLSPYLDQLGFQLVGYGCTTCIGNSGPLPEEISNAVNNNQLVVCSVLSGNRNFEGRVNPDVRANYLASPPLVVAYALAGRMDIDLTREPLGEDQQGRPVYLKDVWPTQQEIQDVIRESIDSRMFAEKYSDVYQGEERWRGLPVPTGDRYSWDPASTYVKKPPFFDGLPAEPTPITDIKGLRVLAMLGDSVTTDHISPAGAIASNSPAARYLMDHGVTREQFNSYGSRRGNHEVMMRGTFANIRLRNLLVPGVEGGYTIHPSVEGPLPIYDAAMKYQEEGVPLLIIAGKEYGAGSSRDWAAKGTRLLGIQAVLAESFERIHRSNLIGMGVLPLQFESGQNRATLGLSGLETFEILGLNDGLTPLKKLTVRAYDPKGDHKTFTVIARTDTPNEVTYYRHGGILPFVLRTLLRR
ncbi:MAG TPA: aconitate hydratase AcnA [Acidobacteriota bacterium]|nr:aconitate hydratase AcnA [Acidobacteriota bacterium]